ncbi:Retrovirus-related Pol polyprotein from transposon 17.6 [Stylophora pistillata]|uniref:Retrovirus-related Pol polyprotein from transposon 17.6 n=1 Tax=Stylophora pistillata TaxID=50429 RepID=A0A2B4R8I4_STYPI|nr:Retrovirus-related Pol polyprotein from transposon 17.6 [Stylophora pistillata]
MSFSDPTKDITSTKLLLCYKIIISPVVHLLKEPEIIIVLDPCMYQVPFAALTDQEGKCLSETKRICTVPSLTTLKVIQDSPPDYHSQTGALILGDPKVGVVLYKDRRKDPSPLPCAKREADMIVELFGVTPLVGEHATKQAVLHAITSASLIHLAANGSDERGEIFLSPKSANSCVPPREESYLLAMREISLIQLRAKLAIHFPLKNFDKYTQFMAVSILSPDRAEAVKQQGKCYNYLPPATDIESVDEHLVHLEEVFKRLREANIKLNPKECDFVKQRVEYLSHIVTPEGVSPNSEKIRVVQEFPTPINLKELRNFLGLANHYRRFVKGFSHIANPLNALTKKGFSFNWTEECAVAFDKLKRALVSAPILAYPNFKEPFLLFVDASSTGIGFTLAQVQNGKEIAIAYNGRGLNSAERYYSTTEREALAFIEGIKKFQPYLQNRKFTVVTDHSSLRWLMNVKDVSGRLARWALLLQQYDFEIIHSPGNNRKRNSWDSFPQLVVPPALRFEILSIMHDHISGAHFGVHKTFNKVKQRYWWKGMYKDVEHWCKSCTECSMSKSPRNTKKAPLLPIPVENAFDRVTVDVLGPFPPSNKGNRTSILEAISHSPLYVLYGREPPLPMDVKYLPPLDDDVTASVFGHRKRIVENIELAQNMARENLQRAQQKIKDYYDQNAKEPVFEVGQRVWVNTPRTKKGLSRKLLHNWSGPYRIVEQSSPVHFRLRTDTNKKVTFAVHANRMKPLIDPSLRLIEPPLVDDPREPYLDESDIPDDNFQSELPVDRKVNSRPPVSDTTDSSSHSDNQVQPCSIPRRKTTIELFKRNEFLNLVERKAKWNI